MYMGNLGTRWNAPSSSRRLLAYRSGKSIPGLDLAPRSLDILDPATTSPTERCPALIILATWY